jgi:hypothetical protein
MSCRCIGSGSITPWILNLGNRCRWVVSFTLQPLYLEYWEDSRADYILYYVILCCTVLYYVTFRYVMLWCHVMCDMSCCVVCFHVMLYVMLLCYGLPGAFSTLVQTRSVNHLQSLWSADTLPNRVAVWFNNMRLALHTRLIQLRLRGLITTLLVHISHYIQNVWRNRITTCFSDNGTVHP